MSRNEAVLLVLLGCTLTGCSFDPERLPNGSTYIKGGHEVYSVYYVRERDGTLVYAFIAHPALQVVSTNDPTLPPSPTGVHRLTYARDGVWINGTKAAIPSASPVFAIRRDGSVHPVSCSDEQVRAIGPNGGIRDAEFVVSVLHPALDI